MQNSTIVNTNEVKQCRGNRRDLSFSPFKTIIRITLVLCSLNLWGAKAADTPSKFSTLEFADDFTKQELELLDLTNKERVRKGLQPLIINKKLACVAQEQSADMARHHHLSHTVKGKHLAIRIKKSGYNYRAVGENIARSKRAFSHVVHMWMKSHGHRINILNPKFKEVGFGITTAKNGDRYFTQVFGAQR